MEHVSFSEKVVLVTGGTRGIGRGIAERFLSAGARVFAASRKEADTAISVESGGRTRHAELLHGDIRDAAEVDRLVAEVAARAGRLDVLVNNAGGSPPAVAATASPRFSTAIVQLNLLAPLFLAQRANALMQEQPDGGVIVNVASVSGVRPSPGTAAYGAAKAGLIHLTKSLAIEWAPKVRVVAVAPGMIRTEQAALHYGDDVAQERVAATVPLGRLGTPGDVAEACLWLAGPSSTWVSGSCLVLDGGGEKPAFLGAAAPPARVE
jgi:NAD(P)-dependent dehydrogenase (short-subunit alcohol dehydrogenase family)